MKAIYRIKAIINGKEELFVINQCTFYADCVVHRIPYLYDDNATEIPNSDWTFYEELIEVDTLTFKQRNNLNYLLNKAVNFGINGAKSFIDEARELYPDSLWGHRERVSMEAFRAIITDADLMQDLVNKGILTENDYDELLIIDDVDDAAYRFACTTFREILLSYAEKNPESEVLEFLGISTKGYVEWLMKSREVKKTRRQYIRDKSKEFEKEFIANLSSIKPD